MLCYYVVILFCVVDIYMPCTIMSFICVIIPLHNISYNIGNKHESLCITNCWGPRELLKREPECIRKNMFACYYCIKSFCCSKTLEKLRRNFFSSIYSGEERHVILMSKRNASVTYGTTYCLNSRLLLFRFMMS